VEQGQSRDTLAGQSQATRNLAIACNNIAASRQRHGGPVNDERPLVDVAREVEGDAIVGLQIVGRLRRIPTISTRASPAQIRPTLHPHDRQDDTAWRRLPEPKLDGYRLQIVKDGRQVKLYSRSGYDYTKRLVNLAAALAGIRCQSAVIDGELFPTSEGHPDFRRLQAAMASDRQHEFAVFAFDLSIVTTSTSSQSRSSTAGYTLRCSLPAPGPRV
jgi:ATP-dependent DNA ligase